MLSFPFALCLGVVVATVLVQASSRLLLWLGFYRSRSCKYVSYTKDALESNGKLLVVDCTHPTAATLTHHKGSNNPADVLPADCSTGLVLNALVCGKESAARAVTQSSRVTSNHFDVDSFLSVWAVLNQPAALKHRAVLCHAARVGDFREAAFGEGAEDKAVREADGISTLDQVHTAVKICCWLNTMEKELFSGPYVTKDGNEKFSYFLPRFGAVLRDINSHRSTWEAEYNKVLEGYRLLADTPGAVRLHAALGLAVLTAPAPLHYYCLFSHSIGCDAVLSLYDGQRYELEAKYTQYVCVHSRPVRPRLEWGPLARALNSLETERGVEGVRWGAARFTDTGPLLRLDRVGVRLSKAERYAHPTDRPMYSSSIPPAQFCSIVTSYLAWGLKGHQPRVGGWSWEELHALNKSIRWSEWAASEGLGLSPGDVEL